MSLAVPEVLVVDAGGSGARARLGSRMWEEAGPSAATAPRLESGLWRLLARVAREVPADVAMVVGAAGAGSPAGRAEVAFMARAAGLSGALRVVPDAYGPLAAVGPRGVVWLAGTGSIAMARGPAGVTRAGGRGPTAGDPGGGVELGRRAFEALSRVADGEAPGPLAAALLERIEGPLEAVLGRAAAQGRELASLARGYLEVAEAIPEEREWLRARLARAAAQGAAAGRRAGLPAGTGVWGFGGLFGSGLYRGLLGEALAEEGWPLAGVVSREAAFAALGGLAEGGAPGPDCLDLPREAPGPPTELGNPRSGSLDRMQVPELVDLFLSEERRVAEAAGLAREPLIRLVEAVATAFGKGGRLVYLGAGTSGRLGVLDASESPPTFHVPGTRVTAFLAGGRQAAFVSVEGAEDDPEASALELARRRVSGNDVVVGIAASGTTPFVEGGLREAARRGAVTGVVTSNPLSPLLALATIGVVLPTGPELLRGSTRMHAGSAAKVALNLVSTLAWVRNGKAYRNYMVDLQIRCRKLAGRAGRILGELLPGRSEAEREALLAEARGRVKTAVLMGRTGLSRVAAERRLKRLGGSLARALDEGGTG